MAKSSKLTDAEADSVSADEQSALPPTLDGAMARALLVAKRSELETHETLDEPRRIFALSILDEILGKLNG